MRCWSEASLLGSRGVVIEGFFMAMCIMRKRCNFEEILRSPKCVCGKGTVEIRLLK